MKINNSIPPLGTGQATGLTPTDRLTGKGAAKHSGEVAGKDNASLSDGAQFLAKAMTALKDTPDVRQERVEALHSQIVAGQYQVNYDELARRVTARLGLT